MPNIIHVLCQWPLSELGVLYLFVPNIDHMLCQWPLTELVVCIYLFLQGLRRLIKVDNELREPVTKDELVAEVCLFHWLFSS